jgi:uncharacterized protein YbaR (Trm112 family)
MPQMIHACPTCKTALKVHKIGALLVETNSPSQLPYKFYQADILECPICGNETVYTNARPDHAGTMKEKEITERIFQAWSINNLYVMHEYPAGEDFFNHFIYGKL